MSHWRGLVLTIIMSQAIASPLLLVVATPYLHERWWNRPETKSSDISRFSIVAFAVFLLAIYCVVTGS